MNKKLKKGDRVVCIDDVGCNGRIKKGKIYIVVNFTSSRLYKYIHIEDLNNNSLDGWHIYRFRKAGNINCSKIILKEV